MPTIQQILRNGRNKKTKKPKAPALGGMPQRSGNVSRVYVISPKKPNSANRKVAKVLLTNGKMVTAYIMGEGHTLQENATVMVSGGGAKDTGTRQHIVRGKLDMAGVEGRKQGRSHYGTKRPKKGNK